MSHVATVAGDDPQDVPSSDGSLRPGRPSQVSAGTVLTVIGTILAIGVVLFLLWQLRTLVRWTVISVFMAVALSPLVNIVQRGRIPRALAILIVYLGLILILIGLGALVTRPLVMQSQQLVAYVNSLYNNRAGLIGQLQDLAQQYGLGGYTDTIQEQLAALPSRLSSAVGPLLTATIGVISSVYASISILLLTFFLILDGERFVAGALRLAAPAQRPRMRRILAHAARAIYGYISGNLTISLIAGIATFIALTVLRMPYAVILALVVAFLDLVPLVGATLGAVIACGVALFVDPVKGGILIVFFVIYQQVENNLIQPVVYGRSVQLHPLAIFLAVLAGGNLLGVLGALLAIPVAEIIRILWGEWLATRRRPLPSGAIVE